MKTDRRDRYEDAATEHARLTAERIAEHLDACARADQHLRGKDTHRTRRGPVVMLKDSDGRRRATLEPGTTDAPTMETAEELDAYITKDLCQPLTARRRGWTVPCERTGTVEPDCARVVIHAEAPVVQITGEIAMDGSILDPRIEYADGDDQLRRLNTTENPGWQRGIEHVASRFRVALID